MGLAFSKTRSTLGIHAQAISVEVHLSHGLPGFAIVGLPETAVKESKDRVRSAIINSQFEFPCRRITVNLAPADLPKLGSGFDLPIALGILAASKQIPSEKLANHEFIAELALNGDLRGVSAIIPAVMAVQKTQNALIIAAENALEASITEVAQVFSAHNLREVCAYFCKNAPLHLLPAPSNREEIQPNLDWSDIKGQIHAKRAMLIAAAGGHNLLLSGPPGSGKTMLAKRLITILPNLAKEEALETAAVHSIQGRKLDYKSWLNPPFRAPHHTASTVALVGGGNPPKPGEISLAHNGVLFLDELTEFNKQVLETLREPLESGSICISRAAIQVDFPARFQLIAAMNPCPCGHWGNTQASCLCSPDKVLRYLSKLSAPLLDRIDLQVQVQALPQEDLLKSTPNRVKESPNLKNYVAKIQDRQIQRQGSLNAHLSSRHIEDLFPLKEEEQGFLKLAMTKLKLSARAYHRLLKVARTIADMEEEERINLTSLQQALAYKISFERLK